MLIERMRTNPEDFSYGGKLYRVGETSALSARDRVATAAAHDRYIKEPQLMADVLKALLAKPEKETTLKFAAQGRYSGTSVDKVWYDEAVQAVRTDTRALSQIYDRTAGRQGIERDN